MKPLPLLMVLTSGIFHAIWNLLLKKSVDKLAFIWWMHLLAVLFLTPIIILYVDWTDFPPKAFYVAAISAAVQVCYILGMVKVYERGDLSVVYPLSRGSAPVFILVLSFVLLNEKASIAGISGIFLVSAGVYVMSMESFHISNFWGPIRSLGQVESKLAIFVGFIIACYSVIDKVGVTESDYLKYCFLIFLLNSMGITVYGLTSGKLRSVSCEWKRSKAQIITSGAAVLLTYFLVLWALSLDKASYVGSVRSVSIVFSVLFGWIFLKEGYGRIRLLGSVVIFSAILLIGLA